LPSIAEPNYVVIAESTSQLVGNLFELEDLGARNLNGIAGSVCVNEQLERLVAGP
jgi:class 3 adenylate cyclase